MENTPQKGGAKLSKSVNAVRASSVRMGTWTDGRTDEQGYEPLIEFTQTMTSRCDPNNPRTVVVR